MACDSNQEQLQASHAAISNCLVKLQEGAGGRGALLGLAGLGREKARKHSKCNHVFLRGTWIGTDKSAAPVSTNPGHSLADPLPGRNLLGRREAYQRGMFRKKSFIETG
jgi:hypothetical protein